MCRPPTWLSSNHAWPPFPGLTQYSGDPQTEWDLNTFGTKEEVLGAVQNLHYKGGNTFTGLPPPTPCPHPWPSAQVLVLNEAPHSILHVSLPLSPSQICGRVCKPG